MGGDAGDHVLHEDLITRRRCDGFLFKSCWFFGDDDLGNCMECVLTFNFLVRQCACLFLRASLVSCVLSAFRPRLTAFMEKRLTVINFGDIRGVRDAFFLRFEMVKAG